MLLLAGCPEQPAPVPKKPPPPAPPPLSIDWHVAVFRGGLSEEKTRLTVRPVPIRNGDSVRIEGHFNRPAFVHVYWIDSRGHVSWLTEDGAAKDQPVTAFSLPSAPRDAYPVEGERGTEIAAALYGDQPFAGRPLAHALRPEAGTNRPLRGVVQDDTPILPNSPPPTDLAASHRRGPGLTPTNADPKVATEKVTAWAQSVRDRLPQGIQFSYIAMAHLD